MGEGEAWDSVYLCASCSQCAVDREEVDLWNIQLFIASIQCTNVQKLVERFWLLEKILDTHFKTSRHIDCRTRQHSRLMKKLTCSHCCVEFALTPHVSQWKKVTPATSVFLAPSTVAPAATPAAGVAAVVGAAPGVTFFSIALADLTMSEEETRDNFDLCLAPENGVGKVF